MKTFSCIAILGLGVATLFAADAPDAPDYTALASKISTVTVYADRAQVVRSAPVTPASGPIRVAFTNLPGWLDEGSVRVGLQPADAGQVLDVQVQRTFLAKPTDVELQKGEAAVREIADEIAALDDEKNILEAQSKQIESIRSYSLEKLPKDTAVREVKPQEYGETVKFVSAGLREIAEAKRKLEKKRRDLQPELNARQRTVNDLRQRGQLEQRTVIVTLQGSAKLSAISLTYMLPGATWEPVHEVRAAGEAQNVTLASYALVTQTTGEDWTGVALKVSTQKSTETLKIPELEALLVTDHKLPRLIRAGADTFLEANRNYEQQNQVYFNTFNNDTTAQRAYVDNQKAQIDNAKRIVQVFENLQQRGTTAHFAALASQTVRSDGRSVRVPIGHAELSAQHRILASPELSLNAAHLVDLTNYTKQPVLPGRVSIFMDGAFLGLTETEFVAPGEGFPLYLGMADHLKLSRTLDKKHSAYTRGGSKTRLQVSFLITVENLSEKAVTLQLADRVPVSETEDIRVFSVKIQPDGKPDNKGLLRWDLNLPARQTKEYRVEYSLEYPNDLTQRQSKTSGSLSTDSSISQQILILEKHLK
jgi:uncharacterized protein (TIGR02231 family)